MNITPECMSIVKESESCRLEAFIPVPGDPPTIAWGHTKGVQMGDTCSQEQADQWLAEDMQEAADAVIRLVKVNLTPGQFAALVDFAYNDGIGALEHSTLLKCVNARDFGQAASEFDRWIYAHGVKLKGLVTRATRRKALFQS